MWSNFPRSRHSIRRPTQWWPAFWRIKTNTVPYVICFRQFQCTRAIWIRFSSINIIPLKPKTPRKDSDCLRREESTFSVFHYSRNTPFRLHNSYTSWYDIRSFSECAAVSHFLLPFAIVRRSPRWRRRLSLIYLARDHREPVFVMAFMLEIQVE